MENVINDDLETSSSDDESDNESENKSANEYDNESEKKMWQFANESEN